MKTCKVSLHEGSGFQEKNTKPRGRKKHLLEKKIMSALFYVKNSLRRVDEE